MNSWIYFYVVVFWVMQIVAQLFFKWGSLSQTNWIWGFLLGNLFGFTSIWLLMIMYKVMNPNVALGLGMGGAFFLTQIALGVVFRSSINFIQWFGIVAMVVGMIALMMGKI